MLTAFPDLSTTAIVCISAAILNRFSKYFYIRHEIAGIRIVPGPAAVLDCSSVWMRKGLAVALICLVKRQETICRSCLARQAMGLDK